MSRTVRDVMTSNVVSTGPETLPKDIAELMLSSEVSAVPVVQGGRVVGIVSETDLLHQAEFVSEGSGGEYREPTRTRLRRVLGTGGNAQRKAHAENAEEVMTRNLVTIGPEESVVVAARTMARHDIKQVPVVDERGHLVGMLGRRDLLQVFVRPDEEIARDINAVFAEAPSWFAPGQVRFSVDDGVVTLEGHLEQHSHSVVLTQLVRGVDGVVGTNNTFTWNVDDMLPPGTSTTP